VSLGPPVLGRWSRVPGSNETDSLTTIGAVLLGAFVSVVVIVYSGALLAAGGHLGVGLSDSAQVLRGLPRRAGDPASAWPEPAASRLPGPMVYWSATGLVALVAIALAVLVAKLLWTRRVGLERRTRLGVSTEARFGRARDLSPLLVKGPERGRFILGSVRGHLVATEHRVPTAKGPSKGTVRSTRQGDRGSVALIGPTRCGKTTAAIAGVLDWDGPCLLSSVKTDLLTATLGWRATRGDCRVFDPTGVTGLQRSSWSPLRGAGSVSGAQAAARALCDAAPRSGIEGGGDFWFQEAEILLSGLLWVASVTDGLAMRDVVRWVFTQDAPTTNCSGEVQPLLLALLEGRAPDLAADASLVSEHLQAVWRLEDRMRSSIYATAGSAIWPWADPRVAAASDRCDIDLEWLTSGRNSLYLTAPLRAAKRYAPAFGGLIGDLLEQIAEHVARTGQPLDPPLLVVLDEIGNTPLRELPELVSTVAGFGVVLVSIWQSVAQMEAAYPRQVGTLVSNHLTKVIYSGVSDPQTFELAVKLLGDEQVTARQVTSDLNRFDQGRSLMESGTMTALAPGHVLRQMQPGDALLIHGTLPPAHLRTRRYYEIPHLQKRSSLTPPSDVTSKPHAAASDQSDRSALRVSADSAPAESLPEAPVVALQLVHDSKERP